MGSLLSGKCPKCEKGKIFQSNGNVFLLKAPIMYERCTECNYKFEKEPGYFIGSLYISYGLAVVEMLSLFLIVVWFLPINFILVLILIAILLSSFFNFSHQGSVYESSVSIQKLAVSHNAVHAL
eukprot:gene25847-46990_t